MKKYNIFTNVPDCLPKEIIETLIENEHIKIERIISKGHFSDKDQWYDEDRNEWVFLLSGNAIIEFYENQEKIKMKAGDYINIPKHCKHRVNWTDHQIESIWLAIYY